MKRLYIVVCTLRILSVVSVLLPAASNSFLDVISYEEDTIKRSLAGTDCSSSADVQCELDGTSDSTGTGIPCVGNLKIRKSDCKKGQPVKQRVFITWQYCNTDTVRQNLIEDKTEAIYKKNKKRDTTKTIPAGKCQVLTSRKSINLCKRGAAMRIKYEGKAQARLNSRCFAFAFLRLSIEKLPEKPCSVSTEVTCRISDGKNEGKQCAGNIINDDDGSCGDVKVQFLYKVCVFNQDSKKLKFNRIKSKALLNGKNTNALNTRPMGTKNPCRRDIVPAVIDSCSTKDTNAKLIMRGTLSTGKVCRRTDYIKIRVADVCDYEFIITELVSKRGASYIEIYSAKCPNKVVSEEFQIVRYKKGKSKPSADNPINLKGLETDSNGFIVLCSTYTVEKPYNIPRGALCADVNPTTASLTGRDTIALISGTVNGDPKILDIFGNIPATDGDNDFLKGRVVRKIEKTDQNSSFDLNDWNFTVPLTADDTTDPRQWFDIGKAPSLRLETDPTKATQPPIKAQTGAPTKRPAKAPTKPPTSTPFAPEVVPTRSPNSPTNSPTTEPNDDEPNDAPFESPSPSSEHTHSCDTTPYITEVAVFNNYVTFVELRTEQTCAYGQNIIKSTLLRIGGTSIQLQGKSYDDDGYIVICDVGMDMDDETCNGGWFSPVSLVDGSVSIQLEIVTGPIDVVIIICKDANISCRLYRKNTSTTGVFPFIRANWIREIGGVPNPGEGEPQSSTPISNSPTRAPTSARVTPTQSPNKLPTNELYNGDEPTNEPTNNDMYNYDEPTDTPFEFPSSSVSNYPTRAPTSARVNPTQSPNKLPTNEPYNDDEPTNEPTNDDMYNYNEPTHAPSESPLSSAEPTYPCNTTPYITEVAVINNQVRFIELRAQSACAYGRRIIKSTLLRIDGFDIQLKGKNYNDDGYLVICEVDANINMGLDNDTCNGGRFSPVLLVNGHIKIQLFDLHYDFLDEVIVHCNEPNIGCRYLREYVFNTCSPFDKNDWIVIIGGDETPGTGEAPTVSPRTNSPTSSRGFTTSYPTSRGKGKGKGETKCPKSPKS